MSTDLDEANEIVETRENEQGLFDLCPLCHAQSNLPGNGDAPPSRRHRTSPFRAGALWLARTVVGAHGSIKKAEARYLISAFITLLRSQDFSDQQSGLLR